MCENARGPLRLSLWEVNQFIREFRFQENVLRISPLLAIRVHLATKGGFEYCCARATSTSLNRGGLNTLLYRITAMFFLIKNPWRPKREVQSITAQRISARNVRFVGSRVKTLFNKQGFYGRRTLRFSWRFHIGPDLLFFWCIRVGILFPRRSRGKRMNNNHINNSSNRSTG